MGCGASPRDGIYWQTGRLPSVNPFAFTSVHRPWLLHMPAVQLGFAFLADHAGLVSLVVLATAAASAARIWVWLGHAATPVARLLTLPLAVVAVEVDGDKLSPRGQAFGDLLFVLLLGLVLRLLRGERVRFWVPLLLGIGWANCHPSFLLAAALPLAAAAASQLDEPGRRPALGPFVGFALLAIAGSCVNPYGPVLLLDVMHLATDETTAWVDVFRSPDLHAPIWLVGIGTVLAAALLRSRMGEAKARQAEVALLFVLLLAGCWSRRYGPLAQMAAVAVGGRALGGARFGSRRPGALTAALSLAAGAALAWTAVSLRRPPDPLRFQPVAAARFVLDHHPPERLYNAYAWGGYLDYAWGGERRVFIDGRNNLFDNGTFADSLAINNTLAGFERLLDTYEISTVLEPVDQPLDRALAKRRGWQQVYRDTIAVIYVRTPKAE